MKATDNSGKVRSLEVWDARNVQTNMTETTHNSNGTITNITGTPTTATTADPAKLTIEGKYNENQRYLPGNLWTRQIRTKDLSENANNDTAFKVVQGKLSEKFPGQVPATVQVSNATTPSGKDTEKILAAVKGSNPQEANRISGYELKDNGAVVDGKVTVIITYKDGTTNEVKVPVSDSEARSASASASTSASQSASTSASQSASTSASQSASTSASQSVSTSASASASTSASESASTSASQSASTSASQSASTSASESALTSASQSASTSASQSASTSASQSASTSASETPSESVAKSRQQLPNTGTEASKSSVLLGALAAVTGLGLVAKRRKRDNEDEE